MDASCRPYFLDLDKHVFQMTSCVQTMRTEWYGLHFSRFGYLSCTCIWHAWDILWRAVSERLEQISTVQNIFSGSFEKNGPEFHIRLSRNSSTRPRTESVNAVVIMVVSNMIDFWDTFWKTLVWISGC